MPITPLHFGVLAPINAISPVKCSAWSFGIVNLWIDSEAITAFMTMQPLPDHQIFTHTLSGILIITVMVTILGIRSKTWAFGAFYGGFTHWLLDSLVHMDMRPIEWMNSNPMYLGILEPLSLALIPLTIWFILQCVSGTVGLIHKVWEDWF